MSLRRVSWRQYRPRTDLYEGAIVDQNSRSDGGAIAAENGSAKERGQIGDSKNEPVLRRGGA